MLKSFFRITSLQVIKVKLFKLTASLCFHIFVYPCCLRLDKNQNSIRKSSSLYWYYPLPLYYFWTLEKPKMKRRYNRFHEKNIVFENNSISKYKLFNIQFQCFTVRKCQNDVWNVFLSREMTIMFSDLIGYSTKNVFCDHV